MLQEKKINNWFYFLCLYLNCFDKKSLKTIYLLYWFLSLNRLILKKKSKYTWNYPKYLNFFNNLNNIYRHGAVSKLSFIANIKKKTVFYKKKKLKLLINKLHLKKNIKVKNFISCYYTKIYNTVIKKSAFTLKQRLFISKKFLTQQLWAFLYKSVKNNFFLKKIDKAIIYTWNRTKLLFFNFHKPLIWKMRTARYAHWNLRTKGKLNKYRYAKLLGKEMQYILKTKSTQFLLCIFFITYYTILSWKQLLLIIYHSLIIVNGKVIDLNLPYLKLGDIIELPYGLVYNLNNFVKKHYKKLVKKSKKLVYKQYKEKKKLKLNKDKVIPKIFKKLPVGVQMFGKLTAYDPLLNIFAIVYPIANTRHNIDTKITKTSVLCLQNWRYNFN